MREYSHDSPKASIARQLYKGNKSKQTTKIRNRNAARSYDENQIRSEPIALDGKKNIRNSRARTALQGNAKLSEMRKD